MPSFPRELYHDQRRSDAADAPKGTAAVEQLGSLPKALSSFAGQLKKRVTLRVDANVLAWLKQQGRDYPPTH
jgi:uncharacterized protein (DUF4415 family)